MKKRICAVIMCLLLAVNLVGVPKAKAVVSETALLGSTFGMLLGSMGYSWAADNMDVPTFGESIYKLTQEFDEAMKDTGNQLIRDLNLAGLTANGAGKLQFGYAWVQAARSFAEWFYDKFGFADNSSVPIVEGGSYFTLADGSKFYLSTWDGQSATVSTLGSLFPYGNLGDKIYLPNGNYFEVISDSGFKYIAFFTSDGTRQGRVQNQQFGLAIDYSKAPICSYFVSFDGSVFNSGTAYFLASYLGDVVNDLSLVAEKPQEIHYPDVAEDGSQVYEITVDGVTATDIEGIIQGAVDQILAGTAAIAGEVAQAQDVPVEPEVPAASEYAVPGLETIFPFCIPFDIYAFCSALNADPVAPSFEWRMQYAPLGLDYTFEIDLSAFDGVAQILRTMELLAFCVGLAFWTRHLRG